MDQSPTDDQIDTPFPVPETKIWNIALIGLSVFMRFVSIVLNWCLANDYWQTESYAYCYWTVFLILLPMALTSLIYANIVIITNLGEKKPVIYTNLIGKTAISYLFRDAATLNLALKCYEASKRDDKIAKIDYYYSQIKEESNVNFLRLFDTFMESAPQKILQLAIVLRYIKSLTYFRALTFLVHFLSITWCLVCYNRSNRLAQFDKYVIRTKGILVQFCFLLCFTGSRTICIAYMTSLFPLETFAACVLHILLSGSIVFIVDRPKFGSSVILGYVLCLTFGVVYLFIFTPVKDEPTKYKYLVYLSFCFLQNIIVCVLYIPLYIAIAVNCFYIAGIILMIYYYLQCHPGIISTVF